MTDEVTHYDYIHGRLAGRGLVTSEPMYATVQVDEGDQELACRVIDDCGGTVTGVNEHEAGVSITFEARNVSEDTL